MNTILIYCSTPKVTSEEIGQLCQSVLQDLEVALSIDKTTLTENGDHHEGAMNGDMAGGNLSTVDDIKNTELSGSLMVKVSGTLIMTLMRLQLEGIK